MENKKERYARLFAEKPEREIKRYSKKYAAAMLSVCSVILCVLSVLGFLFIKTRFSDTDLIKEWIDRNYVLGVVIMILLIAVQVVIALIPGELLELAAGYAFGAWMGTVVCIVGILLGSAVAILLARRFGRAFVEALYPREKLDALPILRDPKKRNAMTFLLFLIPGTPKDLFTYVIGLTNMSIPLYIALTAVARMPSIIMSTLSGGAFGEKRYVQALAIFIIAAAVSAVGYLSYLAISGRREKKRGKDEKNNE